VAEEWAELHRRIAAEQRNAGCAHVGGLPGARSRPALARRATVGQDLIYLRLVLAMAKPAFGLTAVSARAIDEALPLPRELGLVGKSNKRDRRPPSRSSRGCTRTSKVSSPTTRPSQDRRIPRAARGALA
jgi:hypothetical protein